MVVQARTDKRIRVGIICGGESAEHEISLLSARNILQAYDPSKFSVSLIYIDRHQGWFLVQPVQWIPNGLLWNLDSSRPHYPIHIEMCGKPELYYKQGDIKKTIPLDVCFPIVHGSTGEDGSLQGMLQMLDIPFVGASSGISYLCMDKHYMKIIADATSQIQTAAYLLCKNKTTCDITQLAEQQGKDISLFSFPLFVKPCRQGSSVGVSKIKDMDELGDAIAKALQYDDKALIEKGIEGREIEVSLLGNTDAQASEVGEIRAVDNFYSYKRKYLVDNEAELIVPASFSSTQKKQIQEMATTIYKTFEIQGMARIDMFYTVEGHCFLNEINTLPGFTNISMYPRLWQTSGLPQPELIEKLTMLAMAAGTQYRERKKSGMHPTAE